MSVCVCLSSFLFLSFYLFPYSYSCWELREEASAQANGSSYGRARTTTKTRDEESTRGDPEKKKKRMTAIKQANSSHLSSTRFGFFFFRLCMWKLCGRYRENKKKRTKGGSKLRCASFPRDIWDVESTLQHVTRERTSFSFPLDDAPTNKRAPPPHPKSCLYCREDVVDVRHQRQPIIVEPD